MNVKTVFWNRRMDMPIKIYIDQGHNPVNPNAGAEGNGLREQDITYKVGVALADLLNANPAYTARLSRRTPDVILGDSTASSLAARTTEANAWGADYFISLHTNAALDASASGSEAYVYALDSTAFYLAEDILEQLARRTGLRNRGVQARPTLYVLRKTAMPAVLVELGFISNPSDAALMDRQPELFAEGIYNGIVSFTS